MKNESKLSEKFQISKGLKQGYPRSLKSMLNMYFKYIFKLLYFDPILRFSDP